MSHDTVIDRSGFFFCLVLFFLFLWFVSSWCIPTDPAIDGEPTPLKDQMTMFCPAHQSVVGQMQQNRDTPRHFVLVVPLFHTHPPGLTGGLF